MNKLQIKEMWVEVDVNAEPQSDLRIVKYDKTDGAYSLKAEVKKQSGYFLTKEELEAVIKDAMFYANETGPSPDVQAFIDNLLNP